MNNGRINKAMEMGWNKAMDIQTENCVVLGPEEYDWFVFGQHLGETVRELKGGRPAPKINALGAFNPIDKTFFKGDKREYLQK
jgi:hypothetical protein